MLSLLHSIFLEKAVHVGFCDLHNFLTFSVDSKTFILPDLGELKKVRVLHDNSGAAPSWFLKKVG